MTETKQPERLCVGCRQLHPKGGMLRIVRAPDGTVAYEAWPAIDEKYSADDTKTIAVMVNGKLRATFQTASGTPKDELEKTALAEESAAKYIEGKKIVKMIVVPDKLVNIVVQ